MKVFEKRLAIDERDRTRRAFFSQPDSANFSSVNQFHQRGAGQASYRASGSAAAQTTQYVTLQDGGSFPVQTNQLVSVIGYCWADGIGGYNTGVWGELSIGSEINLTPFFAITGGYAMGSAQIPQIATGLTNVFVTGFSAGWATFKIETPTTATVVSNYVPADAIVIPTSATGNVQIILESSPDLVNWTAANPGIYGASAGTNRFFRVRAAAN